MKSASKGSRRSPPTDPPTVRFSAALLQSEVVFWREMLARETDALPPESIERIRQALALAEHRLLVGVLDAEDRAESSEGPSGTSRGERRRLH